MDSIKHLHVRMTDDFREKLLSHAMAEDIPLGEMLIRGCCRYLKVSEDAAVPRRRTPGRKAKGRRKG